MNYQQLTISQQEIKVVNGPLKGINAQIAFYEKVGNMVIVGDTFTMKNYIYEVADDGLHFVQEVFIRFTSSANA